MTRAAELPGPAKLKRSRNRFIRAAIVTAILAPIPPLVGMGGTAMGMLHSFDAASREQDVHPAEFAVDMSANIRSTAVGLLISAALILALLTLAILAVRSHRRYLDALAIESNRTVEA